MSHLPVLFLTTLKAVHIQGFEWREKQTAMALKVGLGAQFYQDRNWWWAWERRARRNMVGFKMTRRKVIFSKFVGENLSGLNSRSFFFLSAVYATMDITQWTPSFCRNCPQTKATLSCSQLLTHVENTCFSITFDVFLNGVLWRLIQENPTLN